MFSYCRNNPGIFDDQSGLLPIPIGLTIDQNSVQDFSGIIGPYNELRRMVAGNPNFEVHHLIEKFFYDVKSAGVFKNAHSKAPCVILSKSSHRKYTNGARGKFAYGTDYSDVTKINVEMLKDFYRSEYAGHDDWIEYAFSCFE